MTDGPTIGPTLAESTPWHPPRPRPDGAPNVIVVMLDDVGFAQLGCYGSDIDTPHIDRLAGHGLRYNRFHVTAMCSPSRAALLTGRNHHAVGMGFLGDLPSGFPGYSARIPLSAATLARVLRDGGYNTMAVGKWHLTPRNDRSAAGPFDTWPLGQGFEHYYGFLHGDANQWTPTLVRDNSPVDPPRGPDEGYHLSEDLVDECLVMIKDQQHAAPGKPFFCYFAPGTAHAPHQVPHEWSGRYAGRFDLGWEQWRAQIFEEQLRTGIVPAGTTLAQRPEWIQDWDALPLEERRLFARFHEVYAGFLSHFDAQFGRLLDGLDEMGLTDETMIVLTSDNGASAEGGTIGSINEHRFGFGVRDSIEDNMAGIDDLGGFRAYNHYPWGWAWAGNTPFKLWKRYSWLGGTRTPLIIKPAGGVADAGAIRNQLCHVVDIFPTILQACGIDAPTHVGGVEQQPIAGLSMIPTFTDAGSPDVRTTQYFEMLGSRSIIHDGWKATTDHISGGVLDEEALPGSREVEHDRWSLHRLADDFSEAHDVAREHPEVVERLDKVWWAEAESNQVLPLQDSLLGRLHALEPPAWPIPPVLVVRPGANPVADEVVPSLATGVLVEADVVVPDHGAEGILAVMGDWSNGWALAVLDGHLTFLLNVTSTPFNVRSVEQIPPGRHHLGFRFRPQTGHGVLFCDGTEAGEAPLPLGLGASGLQIGGGGLRLGHDRGFPVSDDYVPPFAWTGTLRSVTFSSAEMPTDEERAALFRGLLQNE